MEHRHRTSPIQHEQILIKTLNIYLINLLKGTTAILKKRVHHKKGVF